MHANSWQHSVPHTVLVRKVVCVGGWGMGRDRRGWRDGGDGGESGGAEGADDGGGDGGGSDGDEIAHGTYLVAHVQL